MAKEQDMAAEKLEKLKVLQAAISKIEKNYGKGSIMKLGDKAVEQMDTISSGSIALDSALGVGGFPKGRIIEIYGPESSGKTTLAIHAIADNLISSGAVDIIVIDSVAALTPKSEIDGEMGDSKMGLHARLMSQALRKMTATISKTKCCCIFINQLRDKIGVMFGSPETTTGGNALKFYSSIRLDIRRIQAIKDGETNIGNRVRVKIVKNKVAPPFRQVEFDLLFGQGISKMGELVDIGVDAGIIKKSGSWFSYGETKLGQGREAVKQLLADNPELQEEIAEQIKEYLASDNE